MKRFYDVHNRDFQDALAQVRRGRKTSHWMWYIFPQIRGLGETPKAYLYGIASLDEARAFAADPLLGNNLRLITQALLEQPLRNSFSIFGGTDTLKLRSCMTLFELADPDCGLYARVLEEFFGGQRDKKTLAILAGEDEDW